MSTRTGKKLNLIKPEVTDGVLQTMGEDLPENFQKIDDEFSAHLEEDIHQGVHTTFKATSTDNATSNINAPLVSYGGLGVAKSAYIGGTLVVDKTSQKNGIVVYQGYEFTTKSTSFEDVLDIRISGARGAIVTIEGAGIQQGIGVFTFIKKYSLIANNIIDLISSEVWGESQNQDEYIIIGPSGIERRFYLKIKSKNTLGVSYLFRLVAAGKIEGTFVI